MSTLLAVGGMGAVFRATDSLSGQRVALKLLHTESSEALQRFSREAQVLASLRHPGIVSYVAHGISDDGRPFLAMEWLEGEDLAQRLSRQPLSLQESLSLLRSASQALPPWLTSTASSTAISSPPTSSCATAAWRYSPMAPSGPGATTTKVSSAITRR